MREVPRYLQSTLCKSPVTVRNTRFSGREEDAVVRLPGVPQFQFVQDNQVRCIVPENCTGNRNHVNICSTNPPQLQSSKRGPSQRMTKRRIWSPQFPSPTSLVQRRGQLRSCTLWPSLKLQSTNQTSRQPPPPPPRLPGAPSLLLPRSLQRSGHFTINYLRQKRREKISSPSLLRDL